MKNKGFTLIELLVVIAVIGILAAVVLASLNSARGKARDTRRISDLKQIQTALELYHTDNGSYPSTGVPVGSMPTGSGTHYRGVCSSFGSHATTGSGGYVPNLAPNYISVLPTDPKPAANNTCYLYASDGVDYLVMAYLSPETTIPDTFKRPKAPTQNTLFLYSEGARMW